MNGFACLQKAQAHRAADDLQRWTHGSGNGLEQGRFARARFAGEAIDLVVAHLEGHTIDGLHVPLHAEMARAVVGLEPLDSKHRLGLPGRWLALGLDVGGLCGHAPPSAPMRRSRLRGSICSFIDTANRKSPMNRSTTKATGKAIHHQTPATSAVCWLAQ